MIAYRDAGPEDAAVLSALGRRCFTETFGHLYSAENLAAFLANHSLDKWHALLADPAQVARVAESGDEMVAYATVGPPTLPFEPGGVSTELHQFYVLAPWHGKGIAQELMTWVMDHARSIGAEDIYLSVFEDNHRARAFYARYGFEFVQTYDFMVGTHADVDHILRARL